MFFKRFATCLVARASKKQGVVKVRLGRAGEGARELFPWAAGPGTHKYLDPEHPLAGDSKGSSLTLDMRAEWRRSESGHDWVWRLRLVVVANCRAADRSIGSDSARRSRQPDCLVFPTMRTSTDGRGRRSEGGGDRDGRLRIAALANGRAVVRVLGSASLRVDAVDRRRASSRVGSISAMRHRERHLL